MNVAKTQFEDGWDLLKHVVELSDLSDFVEITEDYGVFDDGVGWRWHFDRDKNLTLLAIIRIYNSTKTNEEAIRQLILDNLELFNDAEILEAFYGFGDNATWHFGGVYDHFYYFIDDYYPQLREQQIERIVEKMSFENFTKWLKKNYKDLRDLMYAIINGDRDMYEILEEWFEDLIDKELNVYPLNE